jgi:hypothetical protein
MCGNSAGGTERRLLGRSATDSRPETSQSAWKNEDHRRESHVDPLLTDVTVCFRADWVVSPLVVVDAAFVASPR